MTTAQRLRTDDVAGGGTPAPLVSGKSRSFEQTRANFGLGDVRGDSLATTVITLHSAGAGDSFKLGAYAKGVDGDFARTDTAALVVGTNCAASDLQSELRTATGDTGLTVSGTTDAGPFTVTYVNKRGAPRLVAHTLSAMSVQIGKGTLTYDEGSEQSGTPGSVPSDNGKPFDEESSKGFGVSVPLGHSVDSRGTGQTRGTELLPPTIDSAVGGSGQVVVAGTEVSSGGTNAVALYAIIPLEGGDPVVIDTEDADADVTISSLTAGNYILLAHTQTAGGQVSRPADPVYFTVS